MMEVGVLLEELEARALLRGGGRFKVSLRIKQNDVFCSCCSLLCVLSRFGLRVWWLLSAAHFHLVGGGVCCVLHVGFLRDGNFSFGGVLHDDRSSVEGDEMVLGERLGRRRRMLEKRSSSPHGRAASQPILVWLSPQPHPVLRLNKGIASSGQ